MKNDFPKFKSTFLDNIFHALNTRTKTLNHRGRLTWETIQPDDFEWLAVCFDPLVGHPSIFQFVEDNQVHVFIRSRSKFNRGKILFKIQGMHVVDNGHAIVSAIESTIDNSREFGSREEHLAANSIINAWSAVEVRIVR